MSRKKPKRPSKIYYVAPNGIKIELKDMLLPDKELVGVTVHEPRLNVALTDELKAKGSVEVAFNYGEVNK